MQKQNKSPENTGSLLSAEYGIQLLLHASQQSLKIWSTKSAKNLPPRDFSIMNWIA